ncbi:hypothetical protein FA15DRAFT_670020 [Coprinopsis marcescibilis]|uniref:RRM domain-containing protein n=1 Tax=Coprinopsis marcescibilis TaxID=230819 RepID=A0A5C3KTS6_COPMA|nr:hypothetical protein FA15DRAFT_670020 [Coprinopsis marcescibilis]
MASLLERLSAPGPVRSKSGSGRSSGPYNKNGKAPKGDIESQWSHDLYETHNSLSARLGGVPIAPKANLNNLAQKALQEATSAIKADQLSIKGASSKGNIVEVRGLLQGTTAEDVTAIFKACGVITDRKLVQGGPDPRVRLHFKTAEAAQAAFKKFDGQPADGKVLQVTIVGTSTAGQSLASRFGKDGLGLVREEGSVDILMDSTDTSSKLRSDALLNSDPRAHILVAPPGTNPAEYVQDSRGGRRGGGRGGRGRRGRGGRRGGGGDSMVTD